MCKRIELCSPEKCFLSDESIDAMHLGSNETIQSTYPFDIFPFVSENNFDDANLSQIKLDVFFRMFRINYITN